MSSSRIILVFLGIIFLIIVILSSSRIAGSLKSRFGKFFPEPVITSDEGITPTPTVITKPTVSPSPTLVKTENKISKSTPSGEIPATGPEDILWVLLAGSMATGILIKKYA